METLGNGVHRIAITNEEGNKITGILSQRRLIKYMWENARRFPSLDFYLTSTLQDSEDWVFQPNNNLRGSNVDRSFTQDVQRKSFIASSY